MYGIFRYFLTLQILISCSNKGLTSQNMLCGENNSNKEITELFSKKETKSKINNIKKCKSITPILLVFIVFSFLFNYSTDNDQYFLHNHTENLKQNIYDHLLYNLTDTYDGIKKEIINEGRDTKILIENILGNYTFNKLTILKKKSSNLTLLNNIKNYNSDKSPFNFFIFQIGYEKCGTKALFDFFKRNNISSFHYGDKFKNKKILLRNYMLDNYKNNKPVLGELINKFMFFSDFKVYIDSSTIDTSVKFLNKEYKFGMYKTWYEVLTKQYPNSKYILNIRPVNNWLKSRYTYVQNINKKTLVDLIKDEISSVYLDDIDVLVAFKEIWYKYICDLLNFFKINKLNDNLIIFDIENENASVLTNFFKKFGLYLNYEMYAKNHPTNKNKGNNQKFKKWNSIVNIYPEFAKKENYSEWNQIQKLCKLNAK